MNVKVFKIVAGVFTSSIIISASAIDLMKKPANNRVEDLRREVYEKNIPVKDFDAIEKQADCAGSLAKRELVWQHALDSLNCKAACEKAYQEGAQMVRDSIKVAKKNL